MHKLIPLLLLPAVSLAQTVSPVAAQSKTWQGGFGVGNGLEIHAGHLGPGFMVFGRARTKWWGPESGPGANWFGEDINTRSRQIEAAALIGYSLPVGRAIIYAASGLAYVNGRQLGDYRFSIRKNGGIVTDAVHYYAYRDYQALGLPLEFSVLSSTLGTDGTRAGLALQANLNPEHSVFCVLATFWVNGK